MRNLLWFGLYVVAGVGLVVAIGKALTRDTDDHFKAEDSIPLTEERLRMMYHNADREFV